MEPIKLPCGKEADLEKVLPLTIGDWRQLKQRGCDLIEMSSGGFDVEQVITMVTYVLQKANAEITEEDVLSLPGPWVTRLSEIVGEMSAGNADPPF